MAASLKNRRVLGIGIAGLIALVLGVVIWATQTPILSPAENVIIPIPAGTGERLAAGSTDTGFPERIILTQGDTLTLVNEDSQPHLVGGYFVWENSELTAPFAASGVFDYVCSVHPEGRTVFDVEEKPDILSLVWTELGIAGFTVFLMGLTLGGIKHQLSAATVAIGGVAAVSGLLLALNSTGVFANDSSSGEGTGDHSAISALVAGEVTYQRFCSVCHGETGAGDGLLAGSLTQPPADLGVQLPELTNDALFRVISDGIPESGMPGSADALTGTEISDLIEFLRTFDG